jgi:hypothetical protein
MVDAQGHNLIATAPGSNRRLTVADILALEADACAGGILLTQLETPLETVEYGLRRAQEAGMTTILNPAPARLLSRYGRCCFGPIALTASYTAPCTMPMLIWNAGGAPPFGPGNATSVVAATRFQ